MYGTHGFHTIIIRRRKRSRIEITMMIINDNPDNDNHISSDDANFGNDDVTNKDSSNINGKKWMKMIWQIIYTMPLRKN